MITHKIIEIILWNFIFYRSSLDYSNLAANDFLITLIFLFESGLLITFIIFVGRSNPPIT